MYSATDGSFAFFGGYLKLEPIFAYTWLKLKGASSKPPIIAFFAYGLASLLLLPSVLIAAAFPDYFFPFQHID